MKKNLLYIGIIIFFVDALVFDYLKHGVPAVFFSDLGGIYPDLTNTKDLLFSFIFGWRDLLSQPFYYLNAQSHFWVPLALSFMEDIWLKIKITQVIQILLAAIFSYTFSLSVFKNKKIATISGLFYATTPFFFTMLNGHNSLTWSYVFLPITIFLIERMFLTKKFYWAFLSGIFISLSTFISSIQFVFFIGLPIFIYMTVRYITVIIKSQEKVFRNKRVSLLIVAGISAFAFSGFFLLPTFFEYQPYTQSEYEETYRKNDFVTNFYTPNLKEGLSLQSKEQIVSSEFGYSLEEIPDRFVNFYILSSIIACLSIIMAITKKRIFRNKFIYWPFLITAVSALVLSFGKHTFLFNFFNNFLPYFWTIRTPGRFLSFYIFFVSIMSPMVLWLTFTQVFKKFEKQKIYTMAKVSFVALSVIVLFYIANFYGQFLLTFKTIESMDDHYPDLSAVTGKISELNNNNEYRVLDLIIEKDGNPHHLKAYSAGERIILNNYDILWRFKDDPNLSKILGMLNIKYILTAPWPSWPESLSTIFPPMEKRLEINSDFQLIYTSDSGIKIWENKWALPRTYASKPVVIVGPPSSLSSFLDLIPDKNNFALFFADQIKDKEKLEKLVSHSSMVFIDNKKEERPAYLTDSNVGFIYNDDFYINPKNYSNASSEIMELAKVNNKPVVKKENERYIFSANLISNQALGGGIQGITLIKNTANIVGDGKNGFRLEPRQFNENSEIIYRIHIEKQGRIKINIDAVSLFDDNYVKISNSANNENYRDVLILEGSNEYPEYYEGSIWIDKNFQDDLFLKVEVFSDRETSREIYDSRIETLDVDFIEKIEYNYANITQEELSNIFSNEDRHGLELKNLSPGKLNYSINGAGEEKTAIVSTEIYTPEWILKINKQRVGSIPVNIFNNGYLVNELRPGDEFVIKYRVSAARMIGLSLTFITVMLLVFTFKKRI